MSDGIVIGYRATYLPITPADEESARQNTVPYFASVELARRWGRQRMKVKGDRVRISSLWEIQEEEMEFEEGKMVRVEVGQ